MPQLKCQRNITHVIKFADQTKPNQLDTGISTHAEELAEDYQISKWKIEIYSEINNLNLNKFISNI
jgi:hypothetical protein